uniref:hypothetical protein n=1 Tax=uncultured Desulfovibrio sp. TaxID=167968 RepID=UPI00266EC71B
MADYLGIHEANYIYIILILLEKLLARYKFQYCFRFQLPLFYAGKEKMGQSVSKGTIAVSVT